MASLELRNESFAIGFRHDGRKFTRSLKTGDGKEAVASLARLDENLRLLEADRLLLPESADVAAFLLSDGRIDQEPVAKRLGLGEFFDSSLSNCPMRRLSNQLSVRCGFIGTYFGSSGSVLKSSNST